LEKGKKSPVHVVKKLLHQKVAGFISPKGGRKKKGMSNSNSHRSRNRKEKHQ